MIHKSGTDLLLTVKILVGAILIFFLTYFPSKTIVDWCRLHSHWPLSEPIGAD